jgi:hypothetical protein
MAVPGENPRPPTGRISRPAPATADQLADEVGNARIWGGIHWRFSTADGTTLGQNVARYDFRHFTEDDCS